MSNNDQTATLSAFSTDSDGSASTATTDSSTSSAPADTDDSKDSQPDSSRSNDTHTGIDRAPIYDRDSPSPAVAMDDLRDDHLRDLIAELSERTLYDLAALDIDYEETDLLGVIQTVVDDDDPIQESIDEVRCGFTERPAWTLAAGDQLANRLGFRPFELTVNPAKEEHMSDPVRFDLADDVRLTNNPSLNADIINHATRIRGVTKNGQQRLYDRWSVVIGKDRLLEFKRNRHPDALGFAIPETIPATGEDADRTPVTVIPYVGDVTAADMHPDEGLLSLTDIANLTDKQRAWVDSPVNNDPFESTRTPNQAASLVEAAPDHATQLLSWFLSLVEHELDHYTSYTSTDESLGVVDDFEAMAATTDTLDEGGYSPVTKRSEQDTSDEDSDTAVVKTQNAEDARAEYSADLWGFVEALEEATGNAVYTADDSPARLELPDGASFIISPRITD